MPSSECRRRAGETASWTSSASSIDLEEVLARTLEAGGAVTGADAALVSIHTDDKPIVATKGLSDEEAQRQAISGPPNGHEARAISIAYQYPASLEGEELVHSGLAVPVPGETGSIGFIAIYSRSPTFRFEEEHDPGARGAVQARRPRDRERPPLPRGAAARRPRRAHRAPQPPLLPRDPRARGGARAALRAPPGADHLRPRRLQGDQRPHRPSLRGHGARRDRRAGTRSGSIGRHRLPSRGRRVRGRSFRSRRPTTPTSSTTGCAVRSPRARSGRQDGSSSPRASPSSSPATTRPRFFERADEALYRAKELGKGQVGARRLRIEARRPASPPRGRAGSP